MLIRENLPVTVGNRFINKLITAIKFSRKPITIHLYFSTCPWLFDLCSGSNNVGRYLTVARFSITFCTKWHGGKSGRYVTN